MKKGVVGLIVVFGLIAWGVWQVSAPRRNAEKMRRDIRVGMTLPEVLAVTKGWFYCSGHPVAGPKEEHVKVFPNGKYEIHAEGSEATPANGEDSFQALAKEMKESGVDWEFSFGFVASPRRVYFIVTVGPDGKVKRISELETAD